MRTSDYELSNLILRIEQDKDFKPIHDVINLGALRDLVDARMELARCNTALLTYEGLKRQLESELELAQQMLSAMKHTVVSTIGGVDYEGFHTSEINYLQRLRILLEKEKRLDTPYNPE